jgi:hypothetical protein
MSEESLVDVNATPVAEESGDHPPTLAPNETQTPPLPDGIPEKFIDNGVVKIEDLAKSYKELESKIGKSKDDWKEELVGELKAEQMKDRPADEDSYTVPEIEGFTQEEILSNPLLDWWKKTSFESGFSDEQFHEGIKQFADSGVEEVDLDAEIAKLGENAQARIDSVTGWATKNLTEDEQRIAVDIGASAEGVRFLEKVMNMNKTSISGADKIDKGTGKLTIADLRAKMQDPRYHDPQRRDQSYIDEIERGFQSLADGN